MSNQIPVLYTEQKTKKVKIWLDGFLVPRATLNSARLISAGKRELDVVFYSNIDDIQAGREFETDRYLICVEESNVNSQSCPKPNFVVNDPTMKNRPKSAAFIPPRLVPKTETASTLIQAPTTSTLERHNPNPWGYAGMTSSMKRSASDDDDHDNNQYSNSNRASKITKSSHFIPPTLLKQNETQSDEISKPIIPQSDRSIHVEQQPGLINDALISRLLNNTKAPAKKCSPVKQASSISWSNWDEDKTLDNEDSNNENMIEETNPTKPTYDWRSLVKTVEDNRPIETPMKNSETLPNFDIDEYSFETLLDDLDQ